VTLAVPLADLLARAAEQLVASLGGLRKRSPYNSPLSITKVMIRTVDTDVVVIAVAKFLQIGLKEIWVAFGTGKNYRHIEVHQIVSGIGGGEVAVTGIFPRIYRLRHGVILLKPWEEVCLSLAGLAGIARGYRRLPRTEFDAF